MEKNEFSFFEMLVIKDQCTKVPAADISMMISRHITEVQEVIDEYAQMHGIVTYEFQEEHKEKERKKKEVAARLQADNNKRFDAQVKLAKKQKQHEVLTRNVVDEEHLAGKITVTAKKVNKAKLKREEDEAWLRKKKAVSTIQEQAQTRKRKKAEEPKFKTKVVKYSEFTVIRIDAKTVIYAKPGQKPEHAIALYHKNRNDPKNNIGFQKQIPK